MGNLKEAVYVNGEGGLAANIAYVSVRVEEAPIDVCVIDIGENGHIAFIAPPADFETRKNCIVVNLNTRCKAQHNFSGSQNVEAEAVRAGICGRTARPPQASGSCNNIPFAQIS